jgi:galactofuranosylgalactofuranosylrhamnosyl-N-acetylglucosaminyl-diphospho-decaprenol beta-1,5/1,6-galactofuranosyltransferase
MDNAISQDSTSSALRPQLNILPDVALREHHIQLQRVAFDRSPATLDLYFRALSHARRPSLQNGRLSIPPGQLISFDSYFGAFFEQPWHAHTKLKSLLLTLDIRGHCSVRVARRGRHGADVTLFERELAGSLSPVEFSLPAAPEGLNAPTRLYFEVRTRLRSAALLSATWSTLESTPTPVGLVPVFCTFNREKQLAGVLASVAQDPAACAALAQVVVVNQGKPGLIDHQAMASLPNHFLEKLTVIEQPNYGGAGGFTRGIMAAQGMAGATHVVLMDDDVEAEPESLSRMAAFFSLAKPNLALGGHMLDLLQPTRLYEAGAQIGYKKWYLEPQRMHLNLADHRELDHLLEARPIHYNGWWMFAVPLKIVDQVGLPLPCFIRGDDVEYGRRLHDQGIYTVSLPGVAIWHEPFYVKLGSWQLYYEMRNLLITAAMHFPRRPLPLAVLLLKRMLIYLLTYRYYSAALILKAVEDYLQGPATLRCSPQKTHASLEIFKHRFPTGDVERDRVIPDARLQPDPRSLAGFVFRMVASLAKNALVPAAPHARGVRMRSDDLVWFRVVPFDEVVADSGWDLRPPVYRRSLPAFRTLMMHILIVLWRVMKEGGAVARSWKMAHEDLTSPGFWRRYLHIDEAPKAEDRHQQPCSSKADRSAPVVKESDGCHP